MAIMLLILLFALLPMAVYVGHRQFAERKVRQAGIGPDQPGCPRCYYPVRGWASTICPECGADIRETGVRTGPATSCALRVAVFTITTFILVVPLSSMVIDRLARIYTVEFQTQLAMPSANQKQPVFAVVSTDRVTQNLPPRDELTTTVSFLTSSIAQAMSETRTIVFRADAMPNFESIAQQIDPELVPDAQRDKAAGAVIEEIRSQRLEVLNQGNGQSTSAAFRVGQSSSSSNGSAEWAFPVVLITMIGVPIAAAVLAYRSHRPYLVPWAEFNESDPHSTFESESESE